MPNVYRLMLVVSVLRFVVKLECYGSAMQIALGEYCYALAMLLGLSLSGTP